MTEDWLKTVYRENGVFYPVPTNTNLWVYHPDRVATGADSVAAQVKGIEVREKLRVWLSEPKAQMWAFMHAYGNQRELWFAKTRLANYSKPLITALAWHMLKAFNGPYATMKASDSDPQAVDFTAGVAAFGIMMKSRNYEFDVFKGNVFSDQIERAREHNARETLRFITKNHEERQVNQYLEEIQEAADNDDKLGEFARFLISYRVPARDGGGWARSR